MLVAALCRCLYRRGVKVVPFKPQNMALNSAVTAEGGEIGRAQAVQAQAAGLAPHVDMNPVLLKPSTDTGAQVIIHGKAIANMQAGVYHDYKRVAMDAVLASHARLTGQFQCVVVEGAGSPAEINLREGDIANMGFAEAVDCPVILVADIDRGGVFAQLVGTLALLSDTEKERVAGFVINKFRGDIALLQSGLDWLEERTGKPVIGVLPYLNNLQIAAEDAVDATQNNDTNDTRITIAVPVFSRISNHTDFDMLRALSHVNLVYVPPHSQIPPCDLIILPGSKNVRGDLAFMRDMGWHHDIARHLRYGGKVLGICGGYQMLGKLVCDPDGVEGSPGDTSGLGYLDVRTVLRNEKQLTLSKGQLCLHENRVLPAVSTGVAVEGYQIHVGVTDVNEAACFAIFSDDQKEGAISPDNQVAGTYLHGVFDSAAALETILVWAGARVQIEQSYTDIQEKELNRLADMCEQHLDWKIIDSLIG